MEAVNFVYWLQGYLELSKDKNLDEEQIKVIEEHINLVLQKKTNLLPPQWINPIYQKPLCTNHDIFDSTPEITSHNAMLQFPVGS